jgi:hypothetical protein
MPGGAGGGVAESPLRGEPLADIAQVINTLASSIR